MIRLEGVPVDSSRDRGTNPPKLTRSRSNGFGKRELTARAPRSPGGRVRRRLRGSRVVALRGGEHAPHRAQHHPEVAPVIGVDDEAFANGAEKCRKDRQIGALPGPRYRGGGESGAARRE